MNGRIYDYNLGRFMSVDPFVHLQGDSQGINPYSYIMNNPMAGTDPTGYIPIIPAIIWAYSAYETANAASDTYESYQNGDISGADAATAVGVSAIESTVGKKVKLAKEGLQKVRQAFKGDKPNSNVQNATNASNTDGGTKTTNGADNTQGPKSSNQKTTDIGNPASRDKADFITDSNGTTVRNSPEGARQDLESAGYEGKPTTQTKENGTLHQNVPGADGPMDVRVMDGKANGGELKGPRIRTTSSNNPTDGVRSDGSKFRNNESKAQRLKESHIHLEDEKK